MTQAIVGSYADTLFKEGMAEGMKEGRAEGMKEGMKKGIAEGMKIGVALYSIRILCSLFKIFPSYTDEQITQITKCTVVKIKELRSLLKKTSQEKSGEVIYQKYFKNLELTAKQKRLLLKDIAEYYEKETE